MEAIKVSEIKSGFGYGIKVEFGEGIMDTQGNIKAHSSELVKALNEALHLGLNQGVKSAYQSSQIAQTIQSPPPEKKPPFVENILIIVPQYGVVLAMLNGPDNLSNLPAENPVTLKISTLTNAISESYKRGANDAAQGLGEEVPFYFKEQTVEGAMQ